MFCPLASQEKADALEAQAEQRTVEGARAGGVGDRYVLAVVLLASSLFLLGIQSRVGEFWLRIGLVTVGGFLVVGTTAWILTLPRVLSF